MYDITLHLFGNMFLNLSRNPFKGLFQFIFAENVHSKPSCIQENHILTRSSGQPSTLVLGQPRPLDRVKIKFQSYKKVAAFLLDPTSLFNPKETKGRERKVSLREIYCKTSFIVSDMSRLLFVRLPGQLRHGVSTGGVHPFVRTDPNSTSCTTWRTRGAWSTRASCKYKTLHLLFSLDSLGSLVDQGLL